MPTTRRAVLQFFACATLHTTAIGLLVACGGASGPANDLAASTAPVPVPARTAEQVGAERSTALTLLKAEIGTPLASDVGQCAAIAAGARPCGGPATYFVYSRQVSNEGRLQELAQRFTALDDEFNRLNGAFSICSMEMPPTVTLAGGQCRKDSAAKP